MSAATLAHACPLSQPEISRLAQRAHLLEHLEAARQAHGRGDLRGAAEGYRRVLFAAPRQPAALLGLSLIARQSSQFEPALRMAQAALAASPRSAIAWSNLGDILLARAMSPTGGRAVWAEGMGGAAVAGRASQAALAAAARRAFERALTLDPALHAAHLGLGNAAAQREEYATALGHFTRAAELAPERAEILFALAFTQGKLGRHGAAIDHYRRALLLNPAFASAWLNLGVELVADGRDELAPACYAQAIQAVRAAARREPGRSQVDPLATELSAHLNLGHLARSRRRFAQAQASYHRALELAAAHPHRRIEVHLAFASLAIDQQRFPQAWVSIRAAERLPGGTDDAETENTRGILLLAEQAAGVPADQAALIAEAIAAFARAEALGHRTAASNRANALLRLGRVPEALEAHLAALRRDPAHPGIRYNLALTQLRAGNFAEGWANYEIRWDFREIHPRPRRFAQPRWLGESLEPRRECGHAAWNAGDSRSGSPEISSAFPQHSGLPSPESATLLLYAEQGLGDTLQFVRYLPLVARRLPGVAMVLEVQAPVLRLIAQSLEAGSGTALAGLPVRLVAAGGALPEFTHHSPLMSLPAIFATTLGTVPAAIPYLRARLPDGGRGESAAAVAGARKLSVGIHWAGNPLYRADRERSTRLLTFAPLLAMTGIRWVSLQKGPAAREIDELAQWLRPVDAGSTDADLADAAATVAGLDLVITTDSAVAHLAGALGKPLWLLLPWQSDWRWMQSIETTPWYPTARLWRQSSAGDWAGLIESVAAALREWVPAELGAASLLPSSGGARDAGPAGTGALSV